MPDLQVEFSENTLTVTFNRPQVMNAWTVEMIRDLKKTLNDVARDGRTRVVIFRGAGDNFCTGADINAEKNSSLVSYRAFVSDIQDITRALRVMDAVSIASLQGYCLGGGMELACACDLRIASEDARLGFPEVGIGLTATSGVAHLLPRLDWHCTRQGDAFDGRLDRGSGGGADQSRHTRRAARRFNGGDQAAG